MKQYMMPRNKLVITGVNGFVGPHVARAAQKKGLYVIGIGTSDNPSVHTEKYIDEYIKIDLTIYEQLKKLDLSDTIAIVNLAGLSKTRVEESKRNLYVETNCLVQTNFARFISESSSSCRLIAVSSGAIYDSRQPMPLTEESELLEVSKSGVYANSKIIMEEALAKYTGADIIIARPFNHAGPGQGAGFLIPDLTTKILNTVNGHAVITGNLNSERDFTHVSDVADAYIKLATAPSLKHKVYNICSGSPISGIEIFTKLTHLLGKDDLTPRVNLKLTRSFDPKTLTGSSNRLSNETGWKPKKNLDSILSDYVNWRISSIG